MAKWNKGLKTMDLFNGFLEEYDTSHVEICCLTLARGCFQSVKRNGERSPKNFRVPSVFGAIIGFHKNHVLKQSHFIQYGKFHEKGYLQDDPVSFPSQHLFPPEPAWSGSEESKWSEITTQGCTPVSEVCGARPRSHDT